MIPRARQRSTGIGAASGSQLIAVSYDLATAVSHRSALAARETAIGAQFVRELQFSHIRADMRVLSVPTAKVASVEAALRAQPGFQSVGLTGQHRRTTAVTAPYYTNDPYFAGFSGTQAPLFETASIPGQWDMHVIQLEHAFGYSVRGNAPFQVPSALGSSTVKIAMIDTGQDTTHPELSSKIVYQRCFITNDAGNNTGPQSTSNFTTDEDGHGTDTAGIAAGDINNGLGFASAGGNVEIYAYRVFPTPNDDCIDANSTDVQCGADTADIAAAINDAVNQNVNVISLSLGDNTCVTPSAQYPGGDQDYGEGKAIENAISANIVVVAAAGNSGTPGVNSPGCDTGVIAVGATSLADGQPNGSNKSGGSASAPFEYVASYTDNGTPGADVGSSSAWGIVAPGGDPTGDTDGDQLHWIQNIWTSTPFGYKQSPPDSNFYPYANSDYPNYSDFPSTSGAYDPQTLIAGTSMSTPHVAGAAALIISATGGVISTYQNPTAMKQLLCSTADDISDSKEGCGRLNVYRAMAAAIGDTSPPGPNPVP